MAWRKEENELIKQLIQDYYSGKEIVTKFLEKFDRTPNAIRAKIKRLGKLEQKQEWLNFRQLKNLFGLSDKQITRWQITWDVRVYGDNPKWFRVTDFVRWAGENPDLIEKVNPLSKGLLWLWKNTLKEYEKTGKT